MDRWTDRRTNGQTNRQSDLWGRVYANKNFLYPWHINSFIKEEKQSNFSRFSMFFILNAADTACNFRGINFHHLWKYTGLILPCHPWFQFISSIFLLKALAPKRMKIESSLRSRFVGQTLRINLLFLFLNFDSPKSSYHQKRTARNLLPFFSRILITTNGSHA